MKHPFRTFLSTRGDSRSDAELLAAARGDRVAFTELVARHGPLVWSVCHGLLGEVDAEDAFQATFLALFRATVRDESALASWLHGAALRVSLGLRREAGRRRVREILKPLLAGTNRLVFALDDTPAPRYGRLVQGAGVHHNTTPGPVGGPLVYGHVWVVLGLLVAHPLWGMVALLRLARLYVRKKDLPAIDRNWSCPRIVDSV